MFRFQSLRKIVILLFVFSVAMIFVNVRVFMVYAVITSTSFSNQTRVATESIDINYTVANPQANSTRQNLNEDTTLLHKLKFSRAKRFIRRPWPDKPDCSNFTIRRTVKHNLPPIALASYPGSGNTWVRYLIEAASGIYTGFWGELVDWDSGVTCAQKSHDSGREHIRSFSGGRGIFLNRNPYEAVLSFHNFLYGGHTGHAPSANFRRPEWKDFFKDQTRHWLGTAVNWTQHSSELLTVHYEQLKENPLPQLRSILRFLRLPVDERRLACIQKYPHKTFRRKSQLDWDEKTVFPAEIRPAVDRAIRYVDYLSRRTGNTAAPLDNYSHYNFSGWKASSPKQAENKSWFEWVSDQWGQRIVQSFLDDPITKMLHEDAASNSFYNWKIPFDTEYLESSQLEIDFNSGPPEFIQRLRQQMAKQLPEAIGKVDGNKSKDVET